MKVIKTFIFFMLAVASLTSAIPASKECRCPLKTKPRRHAAVPKPPNADLEMAKIYAGLFDWKDAEIHFAAAAKDPICQKEALAGLEKARRNVDATQTAVLETGRLYESEHLWPKAEDLYRAVAIDPSTRDETRSAVAARLSAALKAQKWERRKTEWKETVKTIAEAIAFLIALVLLIATAWAIWRRRRAIRIDQFSAPTDELANGLAINLKYARAMMQNPTLSPAGPMPAALVANLMSFSDEINPIEDLEIAGAKIPFSALSSLFGQPAVQVSGAFDGVAPFGYAYSIIRTRNGTADSFHQQLIRVGVPHQQRHDLLDFAYDVVVRATSAYASV